ncbi:Methionyl-tRNA formyltransferase [Fimbriiglobus ruber]|uniref:Methionyl-tRNA formyltransferase n=2 Tax=Fimbriiglobus ruber TaxID=1908690 RepID=A0A225E045_9BACT|nr:Methionyl-tRNA formyltransferase [Fimbriiglobus ruber]
MMGTGTFAEPTFEALLAARENVVGLVTQPDRDAGNRRGSTRQTGKGMATIAQSAGVPVAQPESINTPEGLAQLKAFAPDLLVVAAYGQILSKDVIATPPMGAINVHASLLPKYRGASPIAHAILNGETRTGVTIIRITLGLDAGDMLAQGAVDILPTETTGELETRLAPLGAGLCVDVLNRMKAGPVSGEKQDPAQVTKAPKLKKEHGLIDWTKPAAAISDHVRAMQPWPTAYTFFHRPGKEPIRVIINRVDPSASRPTLDSGAPVGSIFGDAKSMGVKCGDASLEVLELQPAGKKRMTAEEFLRGYPIQAGYRFGPEVLA